MRDMLLSNRYFTVQRQQLSDQKVHFSVRLIADCDVYRGHFPGNPVSPGVCNMEMIRECFGMATGGAPRIKVIDRCRFTAVASPEKSPELEIDMDWTTADDGCHLVAVVRDANQQYMDFKGILE
jgi:3-hydroxyacyl-[acyl-carrier-protein] dehydratase